MALPLSWVLLQLSLLLLLLLLLPPQHRPHPPC